MRVCVCMCAQDEAPYVCVVEIEGVQFNLTATVEKSHDDMHTFTCSPHQVPLSLCVDASVLMLTTMLLTLQK